MADAAFDTIAEVQRLRNAGFAQEQAEAITRSIHAGVTGGVATKADLDLVRADMELVRKDVERLEDKIDSSVEALNTKIDTSVSLLEAKIESAAKSTIIWLGGLIFVLVAALGVIERFFPPT